MVVELNPVADDTAGVLQRLEPMAVCTLLLERPDAFTHLLCIKLMPRIRNWHYLSFSRPDADTAYRHIDRLFGDPVNWELIAYLTSNVKRFGDYQLHLNKPPESWIRDSLFGASVPPPTQPREA